jgi:two-component system chemotaxis response regulator CheV
MAGILDSVNQRTQLVGQNRLELLLFRLDSPQIYGINVFKVKEVLQCPPLTQLPKSKYEVRGVAHIRGGTVPIMDLSSATGRAPLENIDDCFVIITEYNRRIQGFLVRSVDRIINMNWENILPPPKGTGHDHYLTAVTKWEEQLVEIIDVEKILSEVSPVNEDISEGVISEEVHETAVSHKILIADDSKIARKQIMRCVEQIGFETVVLEDGKQAWDHLIELLDKGVDPMDEYLLMISDIEMPEMDGYTLTAEIRNHPQLKQMHIILHTSLSGVFNEAMVQKVGANDFQAKFHPDELAEKVIHVIESRGGVAPALAEG